jgi:hypothetical protein
MIPASQKVGVMQPKGTTLQISNHVINARYNYSLIQERIFNYLIYHCQQYIKAVREGMPVLQLQLFDDLDSNNQINIVIPLNQISAPCDYPNVRDSLVKMREVTVSVRYKDQKGHLWRDYTGVIDSFSMPEGKERSNYVIAKMRKDVAEMLVSMDRRSSDGVPINFTSFKYEVCMSSKNKYTPRIYKLIASWKNKGGFYITLDELRIMLDLKNKYKDVEAIKRRILRPVQEELQQNGDCWFNMDDTEFEVKEGKRVVGFRFKVIDTSSNLYYVK